MLSAEMIDSATALRAGLVKEVFPSGRVVAEVRILAHKFIDDRSPVTTMLIRHMLYRNSAQAHPIDAHRIESLGMFYTSLGDGKEGVNAFLNKQQPVFKSKVSGPPAFFPWW